MFSIFRIYLGNKEKAYYYLKKIIIGRDENYSLQTDDISDYEIFDAYYVLGNYNTFLNECEKSICDYYFADWKHYFYTLWIKNEYGRFHEQVDKYLDEFKVNIKEAKLEEDFSSEKEKEEYIQSFEEDLEKLNEMVDKIKNKNYKPAVKLSLSPESGCFLIDSVRHKF